MNKEAFILEAANATRLDKLLTEKYPNFSRSYFQQLIDEGFILVNDLPVKKRTYGKIGDTITITFKTLGGPKLEPENIPLSILYEDEDLIAIDKPIKMVVHPGAGQKSGTFVNALLFHVKELEALDDPVRPGIVHRLDKDTSGVLIAAKNLLTHNKLTDLFKNRQMDKEYIAVCRGLPQQGVLSAPIGRDPYNREKMCITEKGKEAITDFTILGKDATYSVVKAKPKSGRTHQIRVHLRHLGAPIVGDPIYGKSDAERLFLHAHKLSFTHPISNKLLVIKAPLPESFLPWLARVRLPLENL